MKKAFYRLGSIAIIASPIAMVVSCNVEYKGGVIYKRGDKELLIDLSKYTKAHGMGDMAADFESVLVKNNILKTKVGTKLNLKISWKYVTKDKGKYGEPLTKNAIYEMSYVLAKVDPKVDKDISKWKVKYDFAKKVFTFLKSKGFVGGDINNQSGWMPGKSK